MAGPIYGQGFVDLVPRVTDQAVSGFGSALTAKLGPIGTLAGGALAAGLGAAVVGAVATFKIGEAFDDSFDQIRIGTGATGEALQALESDFKAVFADVPTDMGSASEAVADLNTRLGLTGDQLQARSSQFLELSRITGTDLSSNIETATRVFGDWGVAVGDQEKTLDAMFRASQATGIGVDQLGSQLVQYGAPLRQLGFGFETSAALLGKFEKEGVNAELVLGSLRIALGKMARDGEDAETTFERVTDQIANAGSASEANALALELFGARAGPDMAAAIREGRFELGELFTQVSSGSETIRTAAEDTNDWRQSFSILKNRALVALEPLATRVFEAFGNLIEALTPKIESLIGWFTDVVEVVSSFFSGEGISAGPLSDVMSRVGEVFSSVGEIIMVIFDGLRAFWEDWGSTILGILEGIWTAVQGIISGALDVIVGIFDVVLGLLTGDWSRAWEGIKSILGGVWDAIVGILQGAWDIIRTLFSGALTNLSDQIETGFGNVVAWFRELPGRILDAIGNIGSLLGDVGENLVRGLWEGIRSMGSWLASKISSWVTERIPGPIARALGISSPSKVAALLGRAVPEGLAAGMLSELRMVSSASMSIAAASLPPLEPAQARAISTATAMRVSRGFDSPDQAGFGGGISVGDVTVNNPIGEPTEDSLSRSLSVAVSPYVNIGSYRG